MFEESANKITLPSALIWSTFKSLFRLAIFAKEFLPLLIALTLPSIATLIDLVRSLESCPIPVHTPPSQGPTSSPIAPLVTFMSKSAPLFVLIKVLSTPKFNKLPLSMLIVTLPSESI